MKDAARNTDGVPINILVTFRALVHVTHVILLAEHLVIQLIIGAFYHLLAHAANLLGLLNCAKDETLSFGLYEYSSSP